MFSASWSAATFLCVYCVRIMCGCSWILPAIKKKTHTKPSESVLDYEGETVALIVDTHRKGRWNPHVWPAPPPSRIWIHWMNLMGGVNLLWLLWRLLLLVLKVGGIVKGRLERRREEKKGRDFKELWSGVYLSIKKKNRKPPFFFFFQ